LEPEAAKDRAQELAVATPADHNDPVSIAKMLKEIEQSLVK
jgi:hypothetical protein